MSAPGDLDLAARARAGDKAAFEDLLRPLIAPAARLAFGMLQDRSAAEDVLQEAAVKAWRHLGNLRTGSEFRPWFLGIVVNQSRSVRRARWWSVAPFAEPPAASNSAADEASVRAADLRRALRRISADQRAAILLHFYLDLPLDEAAAALGISVSGVKSRINRGLKGMRPMLRGYEAVL